MTRTTFNPRAACAQAISAALVLRACGARPRARTPVPSTRGAVHTPQANRSRRPRAGRGARRLPRGPGSRTATSPGAADPGPMRADHSSSSRPRVLLQRDLEQRGRRGRGGRRVQLGREAQLRVARQPDRVAHDARADLQERGDPGLRGGAEGGRRVAAEQVVEARVPGGADDQGVERGRELPVIGVARLLGRRRGGGEDEPQAVLARALGFGGQRDRVAMARVVEREAPHAAAVQEDLGRLAAHPLVGRDVDDGRPRRDLREGQRDLGLAPRPQEGVASARRRLAIEAFGLVRLRGGRAEQEDLARRPAVRDGDAPARS